MRYEIKTLFIMFPLLFILAYLVMGLFLHIMTGLPFKALFCPVFTWRF